MEQEVKALRDGGRTWKEVAGILGISITTARNYYQKAPEYPKIHDATIHRPVINPRMMLVNVNGKIVGAVARPGNYPRGKKVRVEQIDESHYRILRD